MAGSKSMIVRIGAVLGLGLVMAGCSSIVGHKGYLADEVILQSVQPGVDNRESVQRALGQPSFQSQFGEPVWYYVSSTTGQKPFTTPKISSHTVLAVSFDAAGNVVRAGADLADVAEQVLEEAAVLAERRRLVAFGADPRDLLHSRALGAAAGGAGGGGG